MVFSGSSGKSAISQSPVPCRTTRDFAPVTQSGRELSKTQTQRIVARHPAPVFGFAGDPAGIDAALRYALGFGVLAIFLYVGAEVTIGSVLVNFLMQPSILGLAQQTAGERLSLYLGGAMAGRFVGGFVLRMAAPGMQGDRI